MNQSINIHNVDCADGIKKIPDKSVQLVITSPPYLMADNRYYQNYKDNIELQDWVNLIIALSKEIYRILTDDGVFVLNFSYNQNAKFGMFHIVAGCEREAGFIGMDKIAWLKKGMPINSKHFFTRDHEDIFIFAKEEKFKTNKGINEVISNVWKIDNNKAQTEANVISNENNACFPLELPMRFIELFSDENDIVCDIFNGNGTTSLACKITNRNFIGFELEDDTVKNSLQRLENSSQSNGVWFIDEKDKEIFNKYPNDITIYQYQDELIDYNKNLWYINKSKFNIKEKKATKGVSYKGICKKEDIFLYNNNGKKVFIPFEKVEIIDKNYL